MSHESQYSDYVGGPSYQHFLRVADNFIQTVPESYPELEKRTAHPPVNRANQVSIMH